MAEITVLGAGMVGSAIAKDLAEKHKVTAVDISKENLLKMDDQKITTVQADLSADEVVKELVKKSNIVINAVPGFMGFETSKAVIEAHKNLVDISFFPEDCFELDELARKNGVIAVVDCGVAPGMGNAILGFHKEKMNVRSYKCYVGGLPFQRSFPFQYKAPFSPVDVLEEYTRPARYMLNGTIITRPALSESEFLEFPEIGTLEAFNTDGLRSLLKINDIPDMIEKTLRYPGHIDYIKMLQKGGFFSDEPLSINGYKIRPYEFTSRLLIDKWKLDEEEAEFTIMRIIIEGVEEGENVIYQYDLFDQYNAETGISSMARTTGYSATSAAELILKGQFTRKGINPPEYLGAHKDCLQQMLAYQHKRGVNYRTRRYEVKVN